MVHKLLPYEKVYRGYKKIKIFPTLRMAKAFQRKQGIYGFVARVGGSKAFILYKKVR